jgi:hypothetical protein
MGIVYWWANHQATSIIKTKSHFGNVIKLENNLLLTSDSLNYYVGNTKNYLFFYHEASKTTDVYPMAKVTSITFKNNYKSN